MKLGDRMRVVIPMLIVGVAVVGSRAQTAPIVGVTGGQIRGAAVSSGAVFKGIPFAAPPTGERRWREPMAVQPWSGVRDATTYGAICPHAPTPIVGDAIKTASEDCLFLNVWTAQWPASGAARPVMVWIPGGGNFAGAASQGVYDGESLARRGVVVVSLNYRLGTLGFFSHPALTRESPHHASACRSGPSSRPSFAAMSSSRRQAPRRSRDSVGHNARSSSRTSSA